MAEKHKEGYVATLPTLWATSDFVPRSAACSPQEYRQEGPRRVGG